VEALPKRFTLLALYRVRDPSLPSAFSIRVEASTRRERWEQGRDVDLRLLTSPVTPVSVLARVATLERLWGDKEAALANRRQPRDLYDLWFIAQKLRREFAPDLRGLDRRVIRRELRKYLPRSHWQVIEQWSLGLDKPHFGVADLEKVLGQRCPGLYVTLTRLVDYGMLVRLGRGVYQVALRQPDLPRIANTLDELDCSRLSPARVRAYAAPFPPSVQADAQRLIPHRAPPSG